MFIRRKSYRFRTGLVLLAVVAVFGSVTVVNTAHGQQSGMVESGPFDLEYHIEGSGPPAIVIGFPNYYRKVFSKNLRSNFRLVFIDHRGSAQPPGPQPLSAYSLDTLSDDIELFRTRLDLGPITIIGHSGHALLALEYAKRYPASVTHVVMIGIAPSLGDEHSALAESYWEEIATAGRKAALDRNWASVSQDAQEDSYPGESFIRTYVRNGPKAWYDYDFDSTALWKDVEVNMEMFNHVWGTLLAGIDVTKGLEELERPVFLALGKYDFLVAPPSSWNSIQSKFDDLTIRVFEESGHTPQYEQAELFDSELLHWVESVPD